MLFKNGTLYELTKTEKESVKKVFKAESLRLVYAKERVRKSTSSHNRLPDKPTSISFPLTGTRMVDKISETWTYCEKMHVDNNGNNVYTPKNLYFRGSMMIEDIELIWWLANICPYVTNGKNFNHRVPKCRIEDLVSDAINEVARKEEEAKISRLLFDPEMGLPEAKLRQVAKAYFFRNVDKKSIQEIKLLLESEIRRDKLNGVTKFLELADAENTLIVRGYLQKAIDDDIITYMIAKRSWAWVTPVGQKNELICTINAGSDQNDAIYEFYNNNPKFARELVSRISGLKTVGAPAGDNEEEED